MTLSSFKNTHNDLERNSSSPVPPLNVDRCGGPIPPMTSQIYQNQIFKYLIVCLSSMCFLSVLAISGLAFSSWRLYSHDLSRDLTISTVNQHINTMNTTLLGLIETMRGLGERTLILEQQLRAYEKKTLTYQNDSKHDQFDTKLAEVSPAKNDE